ncbi:hypothetical protein BC332_03194 [Capsicum chinense]|nr:hypothetical protein BC332_03194 [Capsicum chinense]
MELFGETAIRRKIILEGGLVAIDDGSGSGAAVGDNDSPLIVFKIKRHYDYDHTGCTNFSPDFAISSKCSACKCQECKAKHDGVINAINLLTASVKKMTSKRGVIPSKRISYPYAPLEIKAAKRRRKDTSKETSSIEKSKITMPLSLSCTIFSVQGPQERSMSRRRTLMSFFTTFERRPSCKYKNNTDARQTIICTKFTSVMSMIDCGLFISTYTEYLSDGLQAPNNGLDVGLFYKRYAALLWKYEEAKAQKSYARDIKDPRQPKSNSAAPDEEQLDHIE